MNEQIGVWFPTVKTNTGTDAFTERLVYGLRNNGIRAEITWLPLRAEYAPWTVPIPKPPGWATIAHVNTWLHSRFLPRNLPLVATLHHSIHDPSLRPYKGFLRAAYHNYWIAPNERRVMKRADRVVAVSHFAERIARETLIDLPMEVILNGVDTQRFRPRHGKLSPHQPFRLLYVGSWMTRKGVDLLAPIMAELGHGYELRYTGGPPSERAKQSMPENMYDLGRLQSENAVISTMQDADALLLPSRSEGLPLCVLEAMACGLPTIATCGSSLQELIEEGKTGSLCEQDSVQDFAKAIRNLAEIPELWKKISDSSSRFATQYYSLEKMIEAYMTCYRFAGHDGRQETL